ncbi:MAG: ion transporter [Synechococcus sp. SB0668_bin_15]|nr:ion transporter [Synechococcus sp. SB0668_bin_15]MYC50500.1 ion transporter [Synechococcus sp. SB0662_bin_14]
MRRKVLALLGEDDPQGKPTYLNKAIDLLIVASIVLAVLESEPGISSRHLSLLRTLDIVISVVFAVEYLARLWIAPLKPGNSRGVSGVIKYALSPLAIIDLIAIAPTLIGMITPVEFYGTSVFRLVRLVRIGRLGRSNRFRESIKRFHYAITSNKNELTISTIYTGTVIFISSVLMYLAEGGAQKDQFGSISRCLWWSLITVTTIGYGDVYPVTPAGKAVASITALLGIAVIAIPIGIISSGFSNAAKEADFKSDS